MFTLAADLSKWNAAGWMTEAIHHNIHGVDLHPDTRKKLVSVHVDKAAPADLVFWGATGVIADQDFVMPGCFVESILINTRLQPGVELAKPGKPFKRFSFIPNHLPPR